jgi:Domain of unknown function (DUF6378)
MPRTAQNYLQCATHTIGERGKQYDPSQTQERSMSKIVVAFNVITGLSLTEQQGWLFMQLLKIVRLNNSPKFHEDSAIDSIAYAALAAECGSKIDE